MDEEFSPSLYGELRAIGQKMMKNEPQATMSATGLVHEAYARLASSSSEVEVVDRQHLVNVACRVMRHLLVDRAKSRATPKHGGLLARVDFEGLEVGKADPTTDYIAIDQLLRQLEAENSDLARVADFVLFGQLEQREIAEALEVHVNTVAKRWRQAKAWLAERLGTDPPGP